MSSKIICGKRFEGKVVIVTASTQGIGFSIAERVGLEGASVVISSRKQKNVDEAVEKLKATDIKVFGVVCHVSNAQQRKNLVETTVQKYGKIDVVVSNAAVSPSTDSTLETEESVLDKLWEINVKAAILLLKDAARHMKKDSSVVLISSISGYHQHDSLAMYGVSKTALFGLTKVLAAEMAPNTRVNCVAPGYVPTHFTGYITGNQTLRKSIEDRTLLNRLGTTDDMASAVAFLASDDASYITGETLVVAGGMPSRLEIRDGRMSSKSIRGKRFEGKVVIVTASTQGIGFSIAERFGLEGASVVISSRKQKNVDESVEKLKAKGIKVLGVVCHVSNAQQRKNLIDTTVQKYGKIDVVVSNAAVNPSTDSILETQESVLDKLWEINVKAAILLLKDAAPHMKKDSSVILISSIGGYHPHSSMAMYGVTKTALFGLTKVLAAEMAPHTRVNCIAPGFVPTHFADFITGNQTIRKTIEDQTLLKRLGTTDDMASAVAFLASDDASYITGETLVIAGGMPSRL
ncbi:hypothetical protein SADUNF_Sadunf11G0009600 [Salix dunnii]|uniref:Uncharacterized protein n=1 Tax=Salix dunnii TaxID=1413687 RepID=A0A835MPY7_9ROSI|nr:hypothetical protein SADUNF_Sadunf11G0009600 [Salix dunnii]